MRATSETVEGNKVRLTVEVDEPEVDRVLDEAMRTLSRQVRVPGFRPGKVPRQVLEARMGGAMALRSEALRDAIPDFYARALSEAEVDPIAPPEIDITAGEETGALAFDAVVEIRPVVGIPGYAGLKVTVPSPSVSDADVDAQVDRMRETEAELVEVDRPAADGDNVTIDLHGADPSGEEVAAADDYLYEVGSGRVVPELDEQLRGAKVGDVLAFASSPAGASGELSFRVLVKEVKEKNLPEATDQWAAESSEFATVEDLRRDLRDRLARAKVVQSRLALREGALDALLDLVEEEVPEALVDEEVRQRVHDLGHRLEEQRIGMEDFLRVTGRTGEELVAEVRGDARRAVRADLSLRALAEEESIEVTDDELTAEIGAMAQRMDLRPDEVRDRLAHAGRIGAVRSEQRKAKALEWLVDHVEVVDEEGSPVSREDLKVDDGPGLDGEAPGVEAPGDEAAAQGAPGAHDRATQAGDATTGEAGR
ncbi:MAG: trigger factor [Acidimicrobiales bacterium]